MGCALELATACHLRVCAAGSVFSMPEVTLGINPGAGGTARLPRLVGVEAALRMLLTGERVPAREALALGLVDAVCEGSELLERARALLTEQPPREGEAPGEPAGRLGGSLALPGPPRKTRERLDKVQDAAATAAAFAQAEARLAGSRPDLVAPFKILEAVRAGVEESFAAALLKEQQVVVDCLATRATQNKVRFFFATRETAKVPLPAGTEPARIARAAVIGMGTMGSGIAQAILMAGIPVAVWDESDAAIEKGTARIRASMQKRVGQGRLDAARAERMLGLLSATTGWEGIASSDLVIEAVFEDAAVKRGVLRRLEDVCRADAILATNTSTLSLDVLAEGMRRPERLLGLHFFSPAHAMPLVEVIRREGTDTRAVATALQFVKALRKTPVLVNNREGFLVNRLFVPYVKEAFRLLEEGADAAAVDAAMTEFGFPMGPLAVIDAAGVDILVRSDAVLSRAFPYDGCVSPIAVRLVESGRLGQKTGSGVYRYERGDYTPRPCEETGRLIADVQREAGRTPRLMDKEEIEERLVMRLVNEAFRVMEEGIAQRESDLDVAMVLGTGFPDFRGGVLRHARDLGLGHVFTRLTNLSEGFGERFAPCELLRAMTKGAR